MLYLIEYCENYITKTLLESKVIDDIDSYMKDVMEPTAIRI